MLDSLDIHILEAAYYDEEWHDFCAFVSRLFPNKEELVRRVLALEEDGLIEFIKNEGVDYDPTPDGLEKIAWNYGKYQKKSPESHWRIHTTDAGFEFIKGLFEK